MRKIFIIIALGCSVIGTSAQGHKPLPSDWQKMHLQGRAKKLKEMIGGMTTIHYYDERGYEVKRMLYDKSGQLIAVTSHRYNDKGEIIEFSSGSDEPSHRVAYGYKYDSMGNTLEMKEIIEGDTAGYREAYSYDSTGHKVKTISYDRVGRPIGTTGYEYDTSGHLSTETEHLSEDQGRILKYDVRGNLIEEHFYSPDGNLTFTHSYDDKGNMISHTLADAPSPASTVIYTYDFDAHGNWIKKRNSLKANHTEQREIEYYPSK